jgi:hypothetical protein
MEKLKRQIGALTKDLAKRDESIAGYELEKRNNRLTTSVREALDKSPLGIHGYNSRGDLELLLTDARKPDRIGIDDDGNIVVFEKGTKNPSKDIDVFLKSWFEPEERKSYLKPDPKLARGGAGTHIGSGIVSDESGKKLSVDERFKLAKQKYQKD